MGASPRMPTTRTSLSQPLRLRWKPREDSLQITTPRWLRPLLSGEMRTSAQDRSESSLHDVFEDQDAETTLFTLQHRGPCRLCDPGQMSRCPFR
eukprot:7833776-Karenia_brevis.AAC.1